MKLIQTPSLITGVILGASLITLSAASNDSVPEDLNVFFPGTEVSSADVNANFTYLDDEVTTLGSRVDNLESSSSSSDKILFRGDINNEINFTVPEGYIYKMIGGHYFDLESNLPTELRNAEMFGTWYRCDLTGISGVPDNIGTPDILGRLLPSSAASDGEDHVALFPGTSVSIYPGASPGANLTLWVDRIAYSVQ